MKINVSFFPYFSWGFSELSAEGVRWPLMLRSQILAKVGNFHSIFFAKTPSC